MFGNFGPKFKGGLDILYQFIISTTSVGIKGPAEADLTISAGNTPAKTRSLTLSGGDASVNNAISGGYISDGGNITVRGGYGATNGGTVTVTGGQANGGVTTVGGPVNITGGAGAASAGACSITGGAGFANTNCVGGQVNIIGGVGGSNGAVGGAVVITGGAGALSSAGGAVTITSGSSPTGPAGAITIQGGTPAANNGGSITIKASAGVGTNKAGGNVLIQPGAATGSANPGNIQLDGGNGAALTTTAIGGFVTIPTCAGTPTGVPVNVPTGSLALVYDSTNNKFYIYNTAWKGVTLA